MNKKLAIVVPCYNEEEILPWSHKQLMACLQHLIQQNLVDSDSFILYVNDGSSDRSWEIITAIYQNEKQVRAICLANNRGHQNALYAGLMSIKDEVNMAISIDADLQDDIDAMAQMIEEYHKGADIVYGVRNQRDTDTFFKRFTAESFYKLMTFLGAKTVYNAADYRLMSARSLHALSEYGESHLFLRGIVPDLGFPSAKVFYARKERKAGVSKYPLRKMLAFAFNGITSFSNKPLSVILYLGIIAIIISMVALVYGLFRYFAGNTITGWTSLFISIWFLGGVQLASLGIVGQYVGKTFMESKKRPRYIIQEILPEKKRTLHRKKEKTLQEDIETTIS